MILPLVKYLEAHGVKVEFGYNVRNVIIDNKPNKR